MESKDKNDTKKTNEQFIPCEEIEIQVPWGHISGKWWGSKNQQPILAIHGWQDNSGTYDNLAPLLAKNFPILCIDLPGYGLSTCYPQGQYYYVFWDGLLIVRRIIKHFKWDKAKLIGHSMGGAITFLYAATFPDETEFYISLDNASPCIYETSQLVSIVKQNIDTFLKYEDLTADNMPCYKKQDMLDLVYDSYEGSVTEEGCELLMKRGMKPAKKPNTYSFTRDVRLKVSFLAFITLDQVMEFASRITCKVMNIRFNPGYNYVKPENYILVLDKIKESACYMERHVVCGTHHLHLNDAESVAELINNFLSHN